MVHGTWYHITVKGFPNGSNIDRVNSIISGRNPPFFFLIEFSHKPDVKNPARGHKVEKTPSGRKERTTYSPYKEKAEMVQKILGKSDTSN